MATSLPPGVYLGRIYQPRASSATGFSRQPCIVGRGSRFKVLREQILKRAFLQGIALSFVPGNPPTATLSEASDGNQAGDSRFPIQLYTSDGTQVPTSKWGFSTSVTSNDSVFILPAAFDNAATYYLDYQATNEALLDELPFSDIREVLACGDQPNESDYTENEDFQIPTSVTLGAASLANINKQMGAISTGATNTSTGVLSFSGTTSYSHDYHRAYTLTVTTAGTNATAILTWSSTPVAFGASVVGPNPVSALGTPNEIDLSGGNTNVALEYGISVDFAAGNYDLGDTWTFSGQGGATVEIAPEYANTNQHSSISLATGASASTGVLSLYGNTEYTGSRNRTYDLEVISLEPVQAKSVGATAPDDGTGLVAATSDQIGILVDGDSGGAQEITLVVANCTGTAATAAEIQTQVQALAGVYASCTCHYEVRGDGTEGYVVTTGSSGVGSSVVITAGTNDATALLNLGTANGGTETTGYQVAGKAGSSIGATTSTTSLGASNTDLIITVDDGAASQISLTTPLASAAAIVAALQTAIQALGGVYAAVTVDYIPDTAGTGQYRVFSGSVGNASTVTITPVATADISALLGLGPAGTEAVGERSVIVAWAGYGASGLTTGTVTFDDSGSLFGSTLESGIGLNVTFGTLNFSVGDNWTVTALAPKALYGAKDARNYKFSVTTNTAGTLQLFYYTNTLEGGGGDLTITHTDAVQSNLLLLGDNIVLLLSGLERFSTTDTWELDTDVTVGLEGNAVVDWSLTERLTETVAVSEVKRDILGTATGTAGQYFFILKETPTASPEWVRDATNYEDVTYTWVTNTPYVVVSAVPNTDLVCRYEWAADQPSVGDIYYIDAKQVRPESDYNTPIFAAALDAFEDEVGPSETTSHLMIAGRLMFEHNISGLWYVQVRDADSDGELTDNDYRTAVDATELKSDITDVVVLNRFSVLDKALSSCVSENQPRRKHQRMLWVGVPASTPIGDLDTADSLVYLSRKTLQFTGNSPALGKVVLLANSAATYDLTLADNSVVSLTLDGSFIMAAIAALNAAQTRSTLQDTILRKSLPGFKSFDSFNESEIAILQSNNVLYINSSGVIQESYTVHEQSPAYNEIGATNQIINADKVIASTLDTAVIGFVPPSPQAGEVLIKSFLIETLQDLVSTGALGEYTDDDGNVRPISSKDDIEVFRDENDDRTYYFRTWYNVSKPIKRVSGLYSVDEKVFTNNVLGV